jgi:clan AA aspartic protease
MKTTEGQEYAMKTRSNKSMGRFAVPLEVVNERDLGRLEDGLLQPDRVRRLVIQGVVDSGATRLILPKHVVKKLGLEPVEKVKVRHAHGRTAMRDVVKNVHVEIMGRSGTFSAIVEPSRTDALIGAIVLEEFDYLVDCQNRKLVPRDPKYVVSEAE